ncbi:MAG: OmpA family protein [Alphaproteobacteria bacterium]|nr:OmpA family protein [Alphaproteobacteria bacterium]
MPHNSHYEQPLEEESYFVSMTDMMVGLLFIFILILMYFALQYQKSTQDLQKSTERLQSAEDTREDIIQQITDNLRKNDIEVRYDERSGVLNLSDKILRFETQKASIEPQYEEIIKKLSAALIAVVPCYANSPSPPTEKCSTSTHRLEAIFIEGHTDSDSYKDKDGQDLNWELSTNRAVNTYRKIIFFENRLDNIKNDKQEHLISISGYGSKRPIGNNIADEDKQSNRRIALRFIMATPKPMDVIENVQEGLK